MACRGGAEVDAVSGEEAPDDTVGTAVSPDGRRDVIREVKITWQHHGHRVIQGRPTATWTLPQVNNNNILT